MMISYIKKYTVSAAYLAAFGLVAIVGYAQKQMNATAAAERRPATIFQGMALSSVSMLALSFYYALYSVWQWAVAHGRRLIQRYTQIGYEYDTLRAQESSALALPSVLTASLWNYMYTFGFSIFCASYSIDASNVNAAFFFCVGTAVSSAYIYLHSAMQPTARCSGEVVLYTNKKKIKRVFIFLVFLICLINAFSFSSWLAVIMITPPQYDEDTRNSSLHAKRRDPQPPHWRDLWFEILGPLFAPFGISSFKINFQAILSGDSRSVLRRGGGDVYFLFGMPIAGFISMLFLSVYPPTIDAERTGMGMIWYAGVHLMAAPLALIVSLVIYIGAMGQSEYSMVSSSCLCLIFYSYSSLSLPIDARHRHMLTSCCIMSLLVFMLSLLILVIKVYCDETEAYNDNVAAEEPTVEACVDVASRG
jgi:hypothetical protein